MASDDDSEELAQLRAQRASRLGGAAGLAGLRAQQRRTAEAAATASQYYEDRSGMAPSHDRPSTMRQAAMAEDEDDVDDEDEDEPVVVGMVEEADLMHEQLRSQLPMGFGPQEKAVVKPAEIHDKFRREGEATVGPPRPPSFGPPRPQSKAASAAAGSSGSFGPPRPPAAGAAAGPSVGPPRPSSERRASDNEAADRDTADVGPVPQGLGADGAREEVEALVGPSRPPPDEDGDEDDGDADYQDGEGDDPWLLPVTHEVSLVGATRAVTALDIDHTGSRVVAGGLDYMVRLYDFNGMKSDMRPFREIEAQEGHPVHAVSWSPSGDAFIVITGSSQAKIYDRDGITRGEFVRGDMYIRDMKNTKGHISGLCGGQWHPLDRFTAMTCSEDGTVRIWDTHNIMQKTVIKPNLQKPVRTPVTACRYSGDGRLIAAGLTDGSIQLWTASGKFGTSAAVGQVLPPTPQMVEKQAWSYVSRPNQLVRKAHQAGEEVTGLCFSRDCNTLLSRSNDATMKIWDLRKFTQPVRVWDDLPSAGANTMCLFSPDEQLVVTGVVTGDPKEETGALAIFDKSKGELVRKLGMPGNVTALAWHPRLNQIFVGAGTRKTGAVRALYDPSFSERGVLLAAARLPRKPSPFDFQPPLLIREFDPNRKRRRDQVVVHPSKLRAPDPGASAAGVGRQGKIGTSAKTILTQHILKTKGKLHSVDEKEDPREALLKHADKKDEFSTYLTGAYKDTQPKPVFHEEEPEEDEDA